MPRLVPTPSSPQVGSQGHPALSDPRGGALGGIKPRGTIRPPSVRRKALNYGILMKAKHPHKRKLALFIHYIKERETVRKLHKQRKLPEQRLNLSKDKAFRFRYSNIRRVEDRMSRWLLIHYYPRFPQEELYFAAIAARYFNHPPTLTALLPVLQAWDQKSAIALLAYRRRHKLQIFGSSYTIYQRGKVQKHVFICRFLTHIRKYHATRLQADLLTPNIQHFTESLMQISGVGNFMAGQIAADLTYLTKFKDTHRWAPYGPGSQWGLNILYNYPKERTWREPDYLQALKRLKQHLPRTSNLHDVQNALCGFQKYIEIRFHKAKPTLYHPNPEPMP
jgi:hypothetical protein